MSREWGVECSLGGVRLSRRLVVGSRPGHLVAGLPLGQKVFYSLPIIDGSDHHCSGDYRLR